MNAPASETDAQVQNLLQIPLPEAPDDFAEFWTRTHAQSRATPLHLECKELEGTYQGFRVFEVSYDSLDSFRVGGWMTLPEDSEPEHAVVIGHGYGGREAPTFPIPGPPAAALFFCARGFHRSARADLPDQSDGHVIHGIQSPDTYIHKGCCGDLWGAASALLELFPQLADRLDYQGGSFGGGIGALAIPWDDRFRKVFLDVPSFGNHPVRVQIPCSGSGEAVRKLYEARPEIMETLKYFDSASAASRFKVPVFVAAALEDPAVPPEGQFSVYAAIKSPKELFVRKTGHPNDGDDEVALFTRLNQWLTE